MSGEVFRSEAAASSVERQYRQLLEAWPVSSEQMSLPTSQGSTFVLACGPEDGPPVVLLHGAQGNAANWMFDAPPWAEKFRLYAIDMIGEAGLSAQVRPELAGDAHARWLDDVFAGLNLSHAAFVGTSLGGWLALDYAARRPAAVDALALICPAGIGRTRNFLLKVLPLLFLGAWGKRRIRQMVFGPEPAEVPDAMRPFAELAALVAKSIRPRTGPVPTLSDDKLRGLTMPILAIMGGKDALIDTRQAKARLERLAPHAEIDFIEEGYHYLPGQAPRVMDFLERNSVPR